MTTTVTRYGKYLLDNGFVPAAETSAIIARLLADDIIMKRLGRMIGVDAGTLIRLGRGNARYVHRDIAEAVTNLDMAEVYADCQREPDLLDDDVYNRIKEGKYARIPYGHKKIYAHALHVEGWSHSRIARTLHMSGATVRAAITTTAAAA